MVEAENRACALCAMMNDCRAVLCRAYRRTEHETDARLRMHLALSGRILATAWNAGAIKGIILYVYYVKILVGPRVIGVSCVISDVIDRHIRQFLRLVLRFDILVRVQGVQFSGTNNIPVNSWYLCEPGTLHFI